MYQSGLVEKKNTKLGHFTLAPVERMASRKGRVPCSMRNLEIVRWRSFQIIKYLLFAIVLRTQQVGRPSSTNSNGSTQEGSGGHKCDHRECNYVGRTKWGLRKHRHEDCEGCKEVVKTRLRTLLERLMKEESLDCLHSVEQYLCASTTVVSVTSICRCK